MQSARLRISVAKRSEKVLGLVLQLVEVGADGQVTSGHDEPPWSCPWSAGIGHKGGSQEPLRRAYLQVDSVLSADGRRPGTPYGTR